MYVSMYRHKTLHQWNDTIRQQWQYDNVDNVTCCVHRNVSSGLTSTSQDTTTTPGNLLSWRSVHCVSDEDLSDCEVPPQEILLTTSLWWWSKMCVFTKPIKTSGDIMIACGVAFAKKQNSHSLTTALLIQASYHACPPVIWWTNMCWNTDKEPA